MYEDDHKKFKSFLAAVALGLIIVFFLGKNYGRTEQENEMYKQMYRQSQKESQMNYNW